MKMQLYLFILFSAIMLLPQCKTSKESQKKNTPEYVTEKFLYHLNRLEFEEAKQYGTESTKNILNLMQSMVALIPEQQPPQPMAIEIDHCDIQGNIAICYYRANNKNEKIELLKVDDKWLVNLKKESFTAPKLNIDK